MNEIVIQIVAPVLTALVSGFSSWFFTKKKYKVEVKTAEAEATKIIQDAYQELIEDLNKKIDTLNDENLKLNTMVSKLQNDNAIIKAAMYQLLSQTCMDKSCSNRDPYKITEIKDLMEQLKVSEE